MSSPASTTETTREAVQFTGQTLRARLVSYRAVVIATGLIVLASLVSALVRLSWLPLLGVLLLVPLAGLFFCRDASLVGRWQRRILDLWAREQLDLDLFARTLASYPMLPPYMLRGMLGSLPAGKRDTEPFGPALRQALSLSVRTINRCQADRTLFAALSYTTGLACLGVALAQASWWPLVGLLGVPLLRGAGAGLIRYRFRLWKRHILALHAQGLELDRFRAAAAQLDWEGISEKQRDRLLQSLLGTTEIPPVDHPSRS